MNRQDFVEITQRRYEYAMGIDSCNFDLLRSVFCDEIFMDFEDYSGKPAAKLSAEEWVESCKPLFIGLKATQHIMTNPIVEVEGNTASCQMHMQALHFFEENEQKEFSIGGYYQDKLVYSKEKWLISAVTLKIFWARGSREIMTSATKRGEKILAGTF